MEHHLVRIGHWIVEGGHSGGKGLGACKVEAHEAIQVLERHIGVSFVAGDGDDIWTHSGTASIATELPETHTLTIHYRQEFDTPARLHLWAENGDYVTNLDGVGPHAGWTTFTTQIYSRLPYGCRFRNPGLADEWEHVEAKRTGISVTTDAEYWTLEGDDELFTSPPFPNQPLELSVANSDLSQLAGPLYAHVWVNRARGPLATRVPVDAHGGVSLRVYPRVTTSIQFHDGHGGWERHRHAIELGETDATGTRYVVLERPPLLPSPPIADLVSDPPFRIQRPGAYVEGEHLRFVVHAPHAADVQLIGEWTGWTDQPMPMRCTQDGTYWWRRVRVLWIRRRARATATAKCGRSTASA